ncbi:efflux RND transporter periplasmic adaptor subunit [Mesorhizobium loti]|nr:efflux RND transporter periplasmic adaptor subunit [Mesorhizobium loti]PLP60437.1 efflux RND transporter periplasmic adaptor subunit [Mesorhizobium loti]
MDQTVKRPAVEETSAIKASLDIPGATQQRRRGWLYAVLVALVIAAAFGGWRWYAGTPARIDYTTQAAARADLTVQVSATGTLQPLTQVDISSELSGIVRTVTVEENQQVNKGDVLAALDTTKLEVQIERAKASAKAAAAAVETAQVTLRESGQSLSRTSELTKRGMATQQALDTAQAARDRAKAALDSAEASLAIANADLKAQQTDLAKSTIYAPIDGIVLTRSVDPGQTVASSLQAPVLFVIAADLKKMEVQAAIDEADIGTVQPGQNARFTVDAFPERPFNAQIREIAYASVTTDGVVTYKARLEVDNGELLLRPGMTATVSVVTKQAKGALTVPSSAFRFRPSSDARNPEFSLLSMFTGRTGRVNQGPRDRQQRRGPEGTRRLFILKDGQPRPVDVTVGSTNGDLTEVLSGLGEGDLVITAAQQRS